MSTPMTPDQEDPDITLRRKAQSDATNPGKMRSHEADDSAEQNFVKDQQDGGVLLTPNSDDDDAIEITVMGNNKHIEELKDEIVRTQRENTEFKE